MPRMVRLRATARMPMAYRTRMMVAETGEFELSEDDARLYKTAGWAKLVEPGVTTPQEARRGRRPKSRTPEEPASTPSTEATNARTRPDVEREAAGEHQDD